MLFTRYPEAGNTKTRLIPYLGAERAAELQRWMTAAMAREMAALGPDIDRQVHFSGGDRLQMQRWLGEQFTYRPQAGETLGRRLQQAFGDNFAAGMAAVVVPDPDLARSLFSDADVVLDSLLQFEPEAWGLPAYEESITSC